MLKIMTIDEVNAKRRERVNDYMADAIQQLSEATGVLAVLGADVKVGELIAVINRLESIKETV